MGFERRSAATKYQPQDGDTLEKIAERETAAGNALTAAEIARFNWGTADEDVIDEHLRDELGCYQRGEDNRFVISADAETRSDLLIPTSFKRVGLAVDQEHTLRVKKQAAPPKQFEGCEKISGITFEFDKSFVRPSVVGDLQKVEAELAKHPEAKVLIFGHTDKVGSESYNKQLSERRALSVYAFITNQPEIWEDLYQQEGWGLRSVQEILKDMGGPYDPGPVDGIDGPKTRAAVKQFQGDNGLTVDGIAGPNTRKKLFAVYMAGKHDVAVDDGRFMDPKHMGCGELNPVVETEQPNEENRRVTFFLFNEARLPRIPCKHGDLGPCNKQKNPPLPRFKEEFHCSFYDSITRDCPCEGGGGGAATTSLKLVAVDDHFAPETEKLDITYSMVGLSTKGVKLQITSEKYDGQILFERDLTSDEKTDGNDKRLEWDGKITAGTMKERFASSSLSPFKVKLVGDNGTSDEASFKIVVHSLELKLGDFEKGIFDDTLDTAKGQQQRLRQLGYYHGDLNGTAGDAKFKKAVEWFQSEHDTGAVVKGTVGDTTKEALKKRAPHCLDGGALPADGGKAKVFVSGAFVYATDADLNPGGHPRFVAERDFWGDGIKIPVWAKVYVKKKNNDQADCPRAVWGTKVFFEYVDPADDAALAGKQKDYCDKALDYHKNATLPKGDNCHKDRGGKRGDAITKVFLENGDTSKFPFKVAVAQKRVAAVLATAREEDDELRGQAGVIFQPSRMGGDGYILHAYLHTGKDLDSDADKTTAPDVETKTGTLYVWRKVRLNQYLHKPDASINAINMATVNTEMAKAYMEFTGELASQDISQATWNATITAALTPDPDFATIGHVDYASLNTIDFKSYAAYHAAGGALGAAAYTTLCRNKVQGWLGRIMSEFAKDQYHGMTVIRVANGHNAYFTNSGLAPIGEGCYIWWSKATYDAKSYVVEKYALHEMGHCLYLRHHYTSAASGPVASWPASDNPDDHDADDAACAMSYFQTAWHLCGQCVLKLRGWDEAVLSKNDDDNQKA
jgi:outer membrane protein OmpA-like peptidoglycan-associated protein/peptidoglycan hydrolase-like protein with peptidoglycan-binding domain